MGDVKEIAGENTKDRIRASAVKLFKEKGYHGTGMQQIAQGAGVLKGNIYNYYPSKSKLLFDVISSAQSANEKAIEASSSMDGTPSQKIEIIIKESIYSLCQHFDEITVALQDVHRLDDEDRKQALEHAHKYRLIVQRLIEEGQRSGAFRGDIDPTVAALTVVGVWSWMHRWYSSSGPLSPEQIAEQIARLVLKGLEGRDEQ